MIAARCKNTSTESKWLPFSKPNTELLYSWYTPALTLSDRNIFPKYPAELSWWHDAKLCRIPTDWDQAGRGVSTFFAVVPVFVQHEAAPALAAVAPEGVDTLVLAATVLLGALVLVWEGDNTSVAARPPA